MRADASDSAGFIDAFARAAAAGTADGEGGDGRGPSHGFLDQSSRPPSVLAIDLSWVQVGLPSWWKSFPLKFPQCLVEAIVGPASHQMSSLRPA